MTTTDIDELLCWAAEEVMGWIPGPWGDTWQIHPNDPHKLRIYSAAHLTGWPGLGLAVEAARERDFLLRLEVTISSFEVYAYSLAAELRFAFATRPDPGIAGWLALREAMK